MLRAIEWILLGGASTAAILTGVRWRRPARTGPWLLLAGSTACLGAGDVCAEVGLLSTAEYLYLAMFVLVAAALAQFAGGGSLLADRARLIDILVWACASLLVIWVFIVGPGHRLGGLSAAYALGDLLLTGVAVRLVTAVGRNPSAKLLLAGAAGMLVSDVLYPLHPSRLTETGYLVLYLCWALAAVHPSMTGLTQPMTSRLAPWQGRWAVPLAASVATPPLVLLYEAVSGSVRDGVLIAVAGAITLALAITRLADSVTLSGQAFSRERGLRAASAALVAAADPPAVDEAVRAAVGQLVPASSTREVVFAADDRQLLAAALPVTAAPPERAGSHSWWLEGPPGDEATLVCPLWLEPLAVARPGGGALILTGRRGELAIARDALEVLAGQAALALDRINLVEAVGRRDSDLYLRAVIHNTADRMLVIDEDQRIRYASPALRELLGAQDLSPLATLADLVHPDDRGQVRRALLTGGDGTLFCALRRADHSQVYAEVTYRDLRADRLVQGFVVTFRDVPPSPGGIDQMPHLEHVDELPAWVNRRSAQHKFRY